MRLVIVPFAAALFATGFACSRMLRPEPIGPLPPAAAVPPGPLGATKLDGLGDYRRAITTRSPEAQRWFDQGLALSYGFNHDASERSFLKAIEQDPECAMCWWGSALVLGPHVNATMDPANNAKARSRAVRAKELAGAVQAWEQELIVALLARYGANPPADRAPLDRAYAEAMGKAARALPEDADIATLRAEALMDLQPWNYYDAKGRPKGQITGIVSALEGVLAKVPDHPGALHLYIHAVEAADPARAVAAADRLRDLMPGAGHLVHMPAHIYTRVGRYHDAVIANRKAMEADSAYLAACTPAPGVYPLGYVPHNPHFLWWSASMEGDSATALEAAEETARRAWIPDLIRTPGYEFLQDFWVTPMKAQVQFGRWETIGATPMPPADLPYPVAIWHFAQGMADSAQGRLPQARDHLAKLQRAAADPRFKSYFVGPQQPLSYTLAVAAKLLEGRVQLASGKASGVETLRRAVALEDSNPYFEPPLWHQPVRHHLGAALLAQGKAVEAEAVYREDLRRNPGNGWSLHGLAASLRGQGKKEADEAEGNFALAWKHADVTLTATAY